MSPAELKCHFSPQSIRESIESPCLHAALQVGSRRRQLGLTTGKPHAVKVLTKLAGDMWLAAAAAYKAGDPAGVSEHGGRLLQLLLDMDALLASVPCASRTC